MQLLYFQGFQIPSHIAKLENTDFIKISKYGCLKHYSHLNFNCINQKLVKFPWHNWLLNHSTKGETEYSFSKAQQISNIQPETN